MQNGRKEIGNEKERGKGTVAGRDEYRGRISKIMGAVKIQGGKNEVVWKRMSLCHASV
jgi:hypothetical protein